MEEEKDFTMKTNYSMNSGVQKVLEGNFNLKRMLTTTMRIQGVNNPRAVDQKEGMP